LILSFTFDIKCGTKISQVCNLVTGKYLLEGVTCGYNNSGTSGTGCVELNPSPSSEQDKLEQILLSNDKPMHFTANQGSFDGLDEYL
jgi:hypothetical protein